MNDKMNAVRMHVRGGPENLTYEEMKVPTLHENEILISVRAASITPTEFTWNSTFTTREGISRLPIVPSFEVAGIVEDVSPGVHNIDVGDAIYGLLDFWRDGAAADYTVAGAQSISRKPETLDFPYASAVPLSGLTAWQALFDHAKLTSKNNILIHGGGGGVGTYAIQLAHWRGAHVIANCSESKRDLVMDLGADEVIDYNREKFDERLSDIDVVLDTVGGDTLGRSWNVLKEGGTLVTIADDINEKIATEHQVKGISMLVQPDRMQLEEIASLIDKEIVKPVVQKIFPLRKAKEAYEFGLRGHNSGKIVLQVKDGTLNGKGRGE